MYRKKGNGVQCSYERYRIAVWAKIARIYGEETARTVFFSHDETASKYFDGLSSYECARELYLEYYLQDPEHDYHEEMKFVNLRASYIHTISALKAQNLAMAAKIQELSQLNLFKGEDTQ